MIDQTVYRAYITDALKSISENTTRYAVPGVGIVEHGLTMPKRWVDLQMLHMRGGNAKPEKDDRSAHEIAEAMWSRIRGDST